jgi:fibronectin-binding autotransporter adhesin
MYSVAPSGNNVANKGSIVGDVVLSGSGNDTVWLAEGSAVQGNLSTGDGNDKLIVDLGRVKQDGTVDTSGLVSGTVDMGAGNNVLPGARRLHPDLLGAAGSGHRLLGRHGL